MTMRMMARSLAGMFPKAVGQIVTSVVAGICIAWATNWLLRSENPPPPVQPVFVVERVAPLQETAIRRAQMPLFLSVEPRPAAQEAAAPTSTHSRTDAEAIARLPRAQVPEMRHPIEVATLPPIMAEPGMAAPADVSPPSEDRAQDTGFLRRHLPVAQRGIDLVGNETAAIVSAITSTLPVVGTADDKGGGQAATSELY